MKGALAGASATLLGGCLFVVAKDERSVISEERAWEEPATSPANVTIDSRAEGTGLAIRVTWRRTCTYRGTLITRHRVEKAAKLKVWTCSGTGCAMIAIFGILAAPVTLAISGAITAASVGGDDGRIELTSRPLPTRRVACDAPGANIAVTVAAPERAPVTVRTGADGTAFVDLGDPQRARNATVQAAR